MPYNDQREFLQVLKRQGLLKRVTKPLDRKWEVALVAKKALEVGGPALLFQNVNGYSTPVATGVEGTKERVYLGYEAEGYYGFWQKFVQASRHPLPCAVVDGGPCQEVVLSGQDIDLDRFPILWSNTKDKGYYLTATNVIVKDPDSGKRNNSVHRSLVIARDRLAMWVNIYDLWDIIRKHWERGQACPVAIAVGVDPAIFQSASIKIPYDVDELEFAGGLRGAPVEMARCLTVPLEVPATAELVLEGEFPPEERVEEGPFGEFTGYYGRYRASPVLHLKAITHRRDPVYHMIISGFPIDGQHSVIAVNREAQIYNALRQVVAEERIKGIWCTVASCGFNAIVSIKKVRPGEGRVVATQLLPMSETRYVVVVDEDIDPANPTEVEFALTWRSRAEDHIVVECTGQPLDPVAREDVLASKIGIDATEPLGNDKIGKAEIFQELGTARYPTHTIRLEEFLEEWKE